MSKQCILKYIEILFRCPIRLNKNNFFPITVTTLAVRDDYGCPQLNPIWPSPLRIH